MKMISILLDIMIENLIKINKEKTIYILENIKQVRYFIVILKTY
jgi:hypothetical protein